MYWEQSQSVLNTLTCSLLLKIHRLTSYISIYSPYHTSPHSDQGAWLVCQKVFESIHAPSSGAFWHRSSSFCMCVPSSCKNACGRKSVQQIDQLSAAYHSHKNLCAASRRRGGGETLTAEFPRVFFTLSEGGGWSGGGWGGSGCICVCV